MITKRVKNVYEKGTSEVFRIDWLFLKKGKKNDQTFRPKINDKQQWSCKEVWSQYKSHIRRRNLQGIVKDNLGIEFSILIFFMSKK